MYPDSNQINQQQSLSHPSYGAGQLSGQIMKKELVERYRQVEREVEKQQISMQGWQPPALPTGVLGMTENAHAAFQSLCNAFSELQERLSPLTESYPEPECAGGTANQISEASAVMGIRILVERIDAKTTEIHRLLSQLRV